MSAPGNLYSCSTCGASLSLEQLRGTDCPFCHTVFPHHGRAVEHAALVNQIMAQQIQAQYGAPPPQPFNPYNHMNNVNAQIEQSLKTSAKITMFVFIAVIGMIVLVGGIIAVVVLAR
jgi:hypothetical protein